MGGRRQHPIADPVSVVKDYDAAWNAHDVEGVVAFFTDDAVVRTEPPPPDEFGGVYIGLEEVGGPRLLLGPCPSDAA